MTLPKKRLVILEGAPYFELDSVDDFSLELD